MEKQITDTLMMIRPHHFGYNEETASDNVFQTRDDDADPESIKLKAREEFDVFVEKLRYNGVNVKVIEDTENPRKSDAVFPNNWVSFHANGWIITYPMYSESRRAERREDIVEVMMAEFGFTKRYSFEYYEEEAIYLEGTGSMVLDRANKIVYACVSERTNINVLDKWAVLNNYQTCIFHATDRNGVPIYHTNVLMALGEGFVIICLDAIPDPEQKSELLSLFETTEKVIIPINFDQMESFAGNMLQVKGKESKLLVMSRSAFDSLEISQLNKIQSLTDILYSDIPTIERYGGGSVRCMMAEVFYPDSPGIR